MRIRLEPAGTAVPKMAELGFFGESPAILDADQRLAWFAVISPDGKTLATGGNSGLLKIWDLPTHRLRAERQTDKNPFCVPGLRRRAARPGPSQWRCDDLGPSGRQAARREAAASQWALSRA